MANDEILSLRDLLDLKLKGLRLAILSACETGIPGTNLPDEVISLPTGLLQAGAAGVVSSLWSVADLSTMVLLSRFYQLWRTDNLEPPAALRQAQLWLRDSTGPELAPYLQASHP
jgi:CHAT domain-containing protein